MDLEFGVQPDNEPVGVNMVTAQMVIQRNPKYGNEVEEGEPEEPEFLYAIVFEATEVDVNGKILEHLRYLNATVQDKMPNVHKTAIVAALQWGLSKINFHRGHGPNPDEG